MIEDSIDVSGLDEVAALIDRMVAPIESPDMTPEQWQSIIEYLQQAAQRRFADERSSTGEKWPELSEWTKKKKGHDKKLIEKRLLIESMTRSDAPHAIRRMGADSLEFGTNREWAGSHQDGTDRIPRRQFSGISDEDATQITELVADAAISMMMDAI